MYSANHIHFLQHMIKVGYLRMKDALDIFVKLKQGDDTLPLFHPFMDEINEKTKPHSLKLQGTYCEVTGEEAVVLINTADDYISKLQVSHTPMELEYFQTIMNEIVQSDEKRLTQMVCLNLASHLTTAYPISKAEALLAKWSTNGYLVLSHGCYYLGPRSIIEYTSHFLSHCEEYSSTCYLCLGMLFIGIPCGNCQIDIHKHCAANFFKNKSTCPNCNIEWGATDNSEEAS